MTKRLIDLDDELATEAREILGAKTWRDTVNGALGDVVRQHRRRKYLQLLAGGQHDLNNPEVMAGAWRQ